MLAMVHHIHSLLQAATGPMSFVIVIPGWQEDEGWRRLNESAWKKHLWIIATKDHGFCDGAQHQRQDRYRESPYDTGIFILQNNSGAKKWPVHRNLENEVRVAMACAIPTPMMKKRRLNAGRGMADLDGGGGVYKGKKKNRRSSDASVDMSASDSVELLANKKRLALDAEIIKPYFKKRK